MSEEVGKKIAVQFGEQIANANPEFVANQYRAALNAQIMSSLRQAISQAVSGFNQSAPATLTLIDGVDRLVFNLQGQLTLTLRFRDQLIELRPSGSNTANPTSSEIAVTAADNDFNYQFASSTPTFNTPVLSRDEFVACVIRAACGQRCDAE
ncbi:MAG: hypothetical protein J0G35_03270 [Acidobacteriales bacterium]|nr:hypothetical protein [Terriglobales bacterium]